MPDCPVCDKSVTARDPDWMLGHLMSDHKWSFERASAWMDENWPPMDEWPEVEDD